MSLASYMLRDGTLFFLTNLIFNVAQIYLFTTPFPSRRSRSRQCLPYYDLSDIACSPRKDLHRVGSFLTSRFILILRLVGHDIPLVWSFHSFCQ
ncbi:hypothetical protein BD310DRAFT_936511 [Dichomitus squalens]|uniref:Uncharacterized protein n=1 Tax=Dichomitus squalens TaxID=114155 RepID=A0A4Q9PJD0_9APHY|nr:hypothetical protein BD310DRAFT_936511 [Dichomitus squalens]